MSAYFTDAELKRMRQSVPLLGKLFGKKWIAMTPNFMTYGINWLGVTYVLGELEPTAGWFKLPKGYNTTHITYTGE